MRDTLSLIALVQDGTAQLSSDQRERMAKFIARREGKHIQITVRESGKPRSLRQNAYLWSVVYQYIADETGHTTEDIHEFCKMKFLPRQFVEIAGDAYSISKSTTRLSTEEFGQYVDQIVAFAGTELSLSIPPPVS